MSHKLSHIEKVLNVWAIIVIAWSFYRFYFKTTNPIWFDELLAKPVIFLLPLYFFVNSIEKRPFWESLGFTKRNLLVDVVIGLVVGVVFIFLATMGGGRTSLPSMSLYLLFISLVSAFSEETLSRGFILSRLYESTKNQISSVFYASFLFFILRIPILFANNTLTGTVLMGAMISSFVLSVIVSTLFLYRKSIVVPILVHALYLFALYFVS